MPIRSKWESLPTEAINPATLAIDKLPAADIVELMMAEDRKVVAAVQREKERIALGAEMIADSLKRGGRVVFVGAGTSGRLGVLESAEMPPTFGTDPEPGAGGDGRRTRRDLQGARRRRGQLRGGRARGEPPAPDEEGRRRRRLGQRHDAVRARRADARAQGRARRSSSSRATRRPSCRRSSISTIAPAVGPEVIAGSTRLKAGTATKMVLNMLTTAAMIRIGKTYGNLMVDVRTGSEKLKDRARRIVNIITGLDYEEADKLLRTARWNVKAAVVMQKTGVSYPKAHRPHPQGATISCAKRSARTSRRGCARCWSTPARASADRDCPAQSGRRAALRPNRAPARRSRATEGTTRAPAT